MPTLMKIVYLYFLYVIVSKVQNQKSKKRCIKLEHLEFTIDLTIGTQLKKIIPQLVLINPDKGIYNLRRLIQQLVLINLGKGIHNLGRGILQLILINPGKEIHNLGRGI